MEMTYRIFPMFVPSTSLIEDKTYYAAQAAYARWEQRKKEYDEKVKKLIEQD